MTEETRAPGLPDPPGLPGPAAAPGGPVQAEEFDVLLLEGGSVIFSWNTPEIEELARLLGELEFAPSPWCG